MFWLLISWLAGSLVEAARAPRLISTSPQVTELVFQLGHGADLVATPLYSDYPSDAKNVPRLGPLFLPSLERTLRFRPDWVLLDDSQSMAHYEQGTQALGLRAFRFSLNGPDSLLSESRRFLAEVYGEKDSKVLAPFAKCLATLPERGKVSFLAFVWMSPTMLYGQSTFLSRLLERAGGVNAAPASWTTPYPQITEDWVLRHPVDVVYALTHSPSEAGRIRELVLRWWPRRPPRVIALDQDHFARASLTPLLHLAEAASANLTKECHELAR